MIACDAHEELKRWLAVHGTQLTERGFTVRTRGAAAAEDRVGKGVVELIRGESLASVTLWENGMLEIIEMRGTDKDPLANDYECHNHLEIQRLLDECAAQFLAARETGE